MYICLNDKLQAIINPCRISRAENTFSQIASFSTVLDFARVQGKEHVVLRDIESNS